MATTLDNGWGRTLGAGGAFVGGLLGKGSIPDMSPQVETPRFMMKIEGITTSTIEKFEEALPILSFTWDVGRQISVQAGGHLFSTGPIRSSNTEIILTKSTQAITMTNSLSKGEKIDQIVIDELATIMENNVSIATHTYDVCYFVSAGLVIDPATGLQTNFMRLVFRFDAYTVDFHEYDQDGTALGSNSASFNFTTSSGGAGGGGGGGGGEEAGGGA